MVSWFIQLKKWQLPCNAVNNSKLLKQLPPALEIMEVESNSNKIIVVFPFFPSTYFIRFPKAKERVGVVFCSRLVFL